MMKLYLTIIILILCQVAQGQVKDYFTSFRENGVFDYSEEERILNQNSPTSLISQLDSFYGDSVLQVRQQAYYLSYKSRLKAGLEMQKLCVNVLLQGCDDVHNTVSGTCIHYLKNFPKQAFNPDAHKTISRLLLQDKITHFRDLYLMAGYVGIGFGSIQQQLLSTKEYTNNQRWVMNLALARMGHEESIDLCIKQVSEVSNQNNIVAYLVPDLLYTRQKEAIDYCVSILNSDEQNCMSPNPDEDSQILCGYRVLELLAPIIDDFPYKAGPAGTLLVEDYEQALLGARIWFAEHTDYNINTDIF